MIEHYTHRYDRRGADGTVHFVGFSAVPGPQYTVRFTVLFTRDLPRHAPHSLSAAQHPHTCSA